MDKFHRVPCYLIMKSVESSLDVMGGTPVFKGTRVPVQTLSDYIEAGDSINEFLGDFPTVSREQVIDVLGVVRTSCAAVAPL